MTSAVRKPHVSVCGPGEATADEEALAEAVGRLLAERGCVLVCGGLGGAMAAACRGAKSAGGTTIGILPGDDPGAANPWVDHPIPTNLGPVRNAIVAASEAVIAVSGGFGTLSEIAFALRLGRPVVLLGGWETLFRAHGSRELAERLGGVVRLAGSPEEAVGFALAAIGRS